MERASAIRGSSGLAAGAALLGLPLVAGIWSLARPDPVPKKVVDHPVAATAAVPAALLASVPAALPESVAGRRPEAPSMPPIAPANTGAPHAAGMLPHPITPEHRRIFRENSLIGSLDGAMDAKDAPGMRVLLKQYREEYPEDANIMQEGYELIASCLENPGPGPRAAAQRYHDERVDSGLRRYIRRHCLEEAK
jgi:hypothetical protein